MWMPSARLSRRPNTSFLPWGEASCAGSEGLHRQADSDQGRDLVSVHDNLRVSPAGEDNYRLRLTKQGARLRSGRVVERVVESMAYLCPSLPRQIAMMPTGRPLVPTRLRREQNQVRATTHLVCKSCVRGHSKAAGMELWRV